MRGIDVVISGNGAHQQMVRNMAQAVKRNRVDKLLWPAGGSNLMAESECRKDMMNAQPWASTIQRVPRSCAGRNHSPNAFEVVGLVILNIPS